MTARGDMEARLSLTPGAPTKTYVLEVHAGDSRHYLEDLAGPDRVVATDDAFLQILNTDEGEFWVDRLDARFWSFHTDMPSAAAGRTLHKFVSSRRDLDWVWLPSEHLRQVWPGGQTRAVRTEFSGEKLLEETALARDLKLQFSGRNADQFLAFLAERPEYRSAVSFDSTQVEISDADLGDLVEGVNRMGRFAAYGESFTLHQQVVRTVVRRYRQLVDAVERRAYTYKPFEDGGGRIATGQPIVIRFSRPIHDIEHFAEVLFSATEPFRLWGVPQYEDDVARVEAVDLHVGHRLHVDIGRDWLRVRLNDGVCGNTVARLVSNLQHRFDGALTLADDELQALVAPTARAVAAA